MNTPNNQRKKDSQFKIEKSFIQLIQNYPVEEITVTQLCALSKVNRSTFYANYLDIPDLVEKMKDKMMTDFSVLYQEERTNGFNSNDFLKLFQHIQGNQLFYKAYFKLNFDLEIEITNFDRHLAERFYKNKHIEYHMEFFRAGITSMIKKWLNEDCVIAPEELFDILKEEYAAK